MQISRKILSFIIVVFILVGTNACVSIQEVKIGDVHEVQLKGLNNNILTLTVMVPIDNPNSFNVKVEDADLTVTLGAKEIGKVKQIDNLVISRKSSKEYPVTIKIELYNPNDLMSSAFQMFSGEVPDVRLNGTVIVKSFMYHKKILLKDFGLAK